MPNYDKAFVELMGDDVQPRREYIEASMAVANLEVYSSCPWKSVANRQLRVAEKENAEFFSKSLEVVSVSKNIIFVQQFILPVQDWP